MERKGFLGGSDAVRIMNGDWHQLWLEKTGRVESEDLSDNFAVQMGTWSEDFNLHWFYKNYPMIIEKPNDDQKALMRMYSGSNSAEEYVSGFFRGHIDSLATTDTGLFVGVECKHTYQFNTMDKQLSRYMPQIQFYLWLMGETYTHSKVDGMYFSNIFGNNRYECVHVAPHYEFQNEIITECSKFWQFVTEDREPEDREGQFEPKKKIDAVAIDKLIAKDMTENNYFSELSAKYISQESSAKEFEATKKEIKTLIGEGEREVYNDRLSLKKDKRGAIRITIKGENNGI